jgi:hypothetical protein
LGCSNYNKFDKSNLYILGEIEVKENDTYISKLIKSNIENSFNVYKLKNTQIEKYKLLLNLNEKIEGSLFTSSVRKIEMSVTYELIEKNTNRVIYKDSFSRNSLVGPVQSLYSRDQSERNARKRLGISISNDIIIRLIEWANYS